MRLVKLLLIVFLYSSVQISAQAIKDIIKPVNLVAGKTDSTLINDLFYAKDYKVKIKPNKHVDVNFDVKKGKIFFTPKMDFSGMTLVDLDYKSKTYSIGVRSRVQQKFTFKYKPTKQFSKLTLFGSFNGWDRGSLPMKDEDGDGIFEASVPLEPGRYEYKFFGDGQEIVDPNNPEKKPNGFGDFNSLFNVSEPNLGKLFLHVGGKEILKDKVKFFYIYQNQKEGSDISYENLIPLFNNFKIPQSKIKIDNGKIELTFLKSELKGTNLVRLAVSKNGMVTNIQSLNLIDGVPAGNSKNFLWNDAVIYSLMIDRFNDGDKSLNKPIVQDSLFTQANYMGGDFEGIIKKLSEGYFDSLGVNTIWISPVYDNPNTAYKESPAPHRWYSGYHGYWPVNSFDVEEKFGTLNKLKTLVTTAHKHGIKILLDVVANHVHESHPLFKQNPSWFGNLNLPDGRKNLRLWDEYRLTTWFEPYLPKFNFVASQEAINFQATNAIWWLKQTGADGFRQDAVKHIPNEFWRALTKKIKEEIEIPLGKKVYQIGETFGSYDLINSYVNNGQLSAQFNFNLYDTALPTFLDSKISFKVLDAEIKKSFLVYGENNVMGNIMDSHDKNRFMSFADGDLELSQWSATEEGWNNPPKVDNPKNYNKAKLYYAYMNSIPGIPVIYYGSEFGMTGASDPDNRRMMRFGKDLSADERKMLEDVRAIVNVRKNNSALRNGDFLTLIANQDIYSFIRSDMNSRILVVLNKNQNEQTVSINLPSEYKLNSYKDCFTGETNKIINDTVELKIKGSGYMMLILN